LINTYIFGGWGWRWWQDQSKANDDMNIYCSHNNLCISKACDN